MATTQEDLTRASVNTARIRHIARQIATILGVGSEADYYEAAKEADRAAERLRRTKKSAWVRNQL